MRKNIQIDNGGMPLDVFIENNEALLTAIAVTAALILFSKDLSPVGIAQSVSFLLIGGIILIWFEIWAKFPEQVTMRLFLFRYVLLWSVIGIIFCWLYEYRIFWDIFLFLPLSIIAYWFEADFVVQILNIIPVTRKFFGIGKTEKTTPQKWYMRIAIVAGILIAFYFGVWISFGTNTILNILKFSILKN